MITHWKQGAMSAIHNKVQRSGQRRREDQEGLPKDYLCLTNMSNYVYGSNTKRLKSFGAKHDTSGI